jgi:FkbM family methyltransferase
MLASSRREAVAAELGAFDGERRAPWFAVPLGLSIRIFNSINKHLARVILRQLARQSGHHLAFRSVGSGEGAWTVPVTLLRGEWVAYCVGVGNNATFDQQLATDYGLRVYSIDPTPVAVRHMAALPRDPARHVFLPFGVWKSDTVLRLYAPMSASNNLSVKDIHGTGRYVELPCKTLTTIMREQGHDAIDLLKIDIEGSWYEVIQDLCTRDVGVSILCAEFDSPTSPPKALRAVRMLKAKGLELVHAERENLVFVRQELLA